MARDGLCALLCAGIAFGPACLPAHAGKDPEKRLRRELAVQSALEQGLQHLQRGNYAEAVRALEGRISYIDGNRKYLNALRDAYRGHVRALQQAGKQEELQVYIDRLRLLDPECPEVKRAPPAQPHPLAPVRPGPEGLSPPREVVRGQEEDPFAATNSRTYQEAKRLLSEAEEQFRKKNFLDAGRLYEQAHRAAPEAIRPCKDQWAYCKMYRVVQALNEPGKSPLTPGDMEKELRQALSLSDKLGGFGRGLMEKVRRRVGGAASWEKAPVSISHEEKAGNWSVAQTTNFRIFHRLSRAEAERVARIAEGARAAAGRKWFGEAPATWSPRCEVFLHANADDYARETRQHRTHPGHSTFHFESGRVISRRIDLRLDFGHALDAVLPHEATHVVLADRFGQDMPRWADEGMAVLSEPAERREQLLRDLPAYRQDRQLYRMDQLLRMTEWPERRYLRGFYAESVSVVDFLVREKGPQTFVRFLKDARASGYEPALREHYGYASYADFQAKWIRHAFDSRAAMGGSPRNPRVRAAP